jgi:hypothetical protein
MAAWRRLSLSTQAEISEDEQDDDDCADEPDDSVHAFPLMSCKWFRNAPGLLLVPASRFDYTPAARPGRAAGGSGRL